MLRKLYSSFNWFLKIYKRQYITAVFFLLCDYFLSMLPPAIIGTAADRLSAENPDLSYFWLLMASAGVVTAAIYIAKYLWNVRLLQGGDLIGMTARLRLMKNNLRQGPSFYYKNSAGSLLGKATNDVLALEDMAGYGFLAMLDGILNPVFLILIMGITVSWPLTLMSVLPIPFIFIIQSRIGKKLYRNYDDAQEAFDRLNESVLDNVSGVRVVRAFGREAKQSEIFSTLAERAYEKNLRVRRQNAKFEIVSKILTSVSVFIALWVGALLLMKGQVSIGKLISFMLYISMFVWPMFALGDWINVSQMGIAAMDRINELLLFSPDEKPGKTFELGKLRKEKINQGGSEAFIEFLDFSFRYPGSTDRALSNINLKIKSGETLGIAGKIGSGKSSLLKQLLCFYSEKNIEGELKILGEDIKNFAPSEIRTEIGYVPQTAFLFSKTVKENILLGSEKGQGAKEKEARLKKVLEISDLEKDLRQLPLGIESQVGEKGVTLSGGQKQRICIARALMKDPEILIMDDALSAVDAETESRILNRLYDDRRGKINIIAAHRLSCIKNADNIILLERGRIEAQGKDEELKLKSGWYASQARYQFEKEKEGEV